MISQGAEPYYGNSLYANLIVKLTPKYTKKNLLRPPMIKGPA